MKTITCKICGSGINENRLLRVKENMFGNNEFFDYYLCDGCNCLQIEAPPDNIKKYYPSDYYSQNKPIDNPGKIKKFIYKIRSRASQSNLYQIANFINKRRILTLIHYGRIKFDHKILDVGCGNGILLHDFLHYGYTDLTGIDPYLNSEFSGDYIRLYRKELFEINGRYDVIIFNHSFEHIWQQHDTLTKAAELLSENGLLIISLPVLNFAFEKYKENWIQIDAPRHFFLHSRSSLDALCKKHNMEIEKVIFDSTEFQFWGSEQILKGIHMTAPNSYWGSFSSSIFKAKDLKKYRRLASKLNKEERGDQAAFFIRKKIKR